MHAYECDKCGKFFPGQPGDRFLPKHNQRWKVEDKGTELELCRECMDEFDSRLREFIADFTGAKKKREGHIKDDQGHDEG